MSGTIRVKCARCGYNKRFEPGGFYGEEVAARAEKEIAAGRYGGEIAAFYKKCAAPRVLAKPAIFRCPYCGDLKEDLILLVRDGEEEFSYAARPCKKCGKAQVDYVDERTFPEGTPCPKCGGKLEKS